MSPDLSPDEVRGLSFETVRRGYDKSAVDAFRADVADGLGRLQAQLEALRGQLDQLGIPNVDDLATELQTVGSDIATILEEARRTATDLRERAAADAAKWRADAEAEAAALRAASQQESEQTRADAWNQASQMLEQVTKDVENQIAVAKQDALFIRAEAERESLHMTADARRESEEVVRAAKTEAERMTVSAQGKATRTLEEARQAAEGAQERAKALESRRAELLIELDAARQSIGQLERQIDERREELEVPDEPDESDEEWAQEGSHWGNDDGAVRLVTPMRLKEPTPVDADELVQEVAELRSGEPAPPATVVEAETEPTVDEAEESAADEGDVVADGEAEDDQPEAATAELSGDEEDLAPSPLETTDTAPTQEEASASDSEQPPSDVAVEQAPIEADVAEPIEAPIADPDSEPAAAESAPVDEESADEDSGVLDDLFERLRVTGGTGEAAEGPSSRVAEAEAPGDVAEPEVPTVEPRAEDADVQVSPDGETPLEVSTAAEPGTALTAAAAVEIRDRFLLPIENRALRGVKRRIVELQNRALEELRIGEGPWAPDRAMFAADLGPDLAKLAQESYVAGHRASVEMTGTTGSSPPATRSRTDVTSIVVEALAGSLSESYERAVAQGSGARQLAAAVSRVFRAWRTDEAERQLRMASYTAYHEGIVAGLASQGAPQAIVVAEGAHSAQCPSVTGAPFDPAESSALRLPPAHDECPATVVLVS